MLRLSQHHLACCLCVPARQLRAALASMLLVHVQMYDIRIYLRNGRTLETLAKTQIPLMAVPEYDPSTAPAPKQDGMAPTSSAPLPAGSTASAGSGLPGLAAASAAAALPAGPEAADAKVRCQGAAQYGAIDELGKHDSIATARLRQAAAGGCPAWRHWRLQLRCSTALGRQMPRCCSMGHLSTL
jgi:hypothetical protein